LLIYKFNFGIYSSCRAKPEWMPPGALQHIIIRGIERKAIFKNDTDREDFLDRLGNLLEETETACYAWSFMTNHVHLLLRTGITSITTVMRRLLTGYDYQL
jgi:REP element-mobilizing transposase RayT